MSTSDELQAAIKKRQSEMPNSCDSLAQDMEVLKLWLQNEPQWIGAQSTYEFSAILHLSVRLIELRIAYMLEAGTNDYNRYMALERDAATLIATARRVLERLK